MNRRQMRSRLVTYFGAVHKRCRPGLLVLAGVLLATGPAPAGAQSLFDVAATRAFGPSPDAVGLSGAGSAVDLMDADAPVFYSLIDAAGLYARMDRDEMRGRLGFQEPVSVISFHGPWMRVSTASGVEGYVESRNLSDVWIRVVKSRKTVYVYRGEKLESTIAADMAYNFFTDKQQRGGAHQPDHWRTPEGRFYVVAKNPNSQFYRAWVLNYPTIEDADRGLHEGVISASEHRQISQAAEKHLPPPMGTALGGFIEIHGRGTGARTSWTRGCVAIPDAEMDRLWDLVRVGTPVIVEP